MTKCNNCGETVSTQFTRVFGDNEGNVHLCPSCTSKGNLHTWVYPEDYSGNLTF